MTTLFLPRPQNDLTGCPPFVWLPFDNREYPAAATPTAMTVVTGDGTRHSLAVAHGAAQTGQWEVPGVLTPSRVAGGTYATGSATATVWRTMDGGSADALMQYVRAALRVDNMTNTEAGLLLLISYSLGIVGSPSVGGLLDVAWGTTAGASAGRLYIQLAGTTNAGDLLVAATDSGGNTSSQRVLDAGAAASNTMHHFCVFLRKQTSTSLVCIRYADGSLLGQNTLSLTTGTFGSADVPGSGTYGMAFAGQVASTGSKLNVNPSGAYFAAGVRTVFVGRCSASVETDLSAIHDAQRARGGAVPFDLLRGRGAAL